MSPWPFSRSRICRLSPAPSEAKPNFGSVVARPDAAIPEEPAGFTVELYADDVQNALDYEFDINGDLFVSQPTAERGDDPSRDDQKRTARSALYLCPGRGSRHRARWPRRSAFRNEQWRDDAAISPGIP